MVNRLMGIINLSEHDEDMKELTNSRPIAGIPFAGRYRVIDFQLSNMVNSGIELVSIFTRYKFRSLQDHLGPGKSWNLDRKRDGLYMFHPMIKYNEPMVRYGDMENFKNNLNFLRSARQEYVVISRSYMVTNINYCAALDFHIDSGADMTIIYKKIVGGARKKEFQDLDMLNCDGRGNVLSVGKNHGKVDEFNLSLEMYLMKRDTLVDIIVDAVEKGDSDYMREALIKSIPRLRVNGYAHQGETFCINNVQSFYNAQMALLDYKIYYDLLSANGKIYTKIKDEPSTKYLATAKVKNAIIANGSIIEGTVENSILFRRVHVKKGAVVRDSVIFQGSVIEEHAVLHNVITDKNVVITQGKVLKGDVEAPYVIKKNSVI